jgi:hypothetical protein
MNTNSQKEFPNVALQRVWDVLDDMDRHPEVKNWSTEKGYAIIERFTADAIARRPKRQPRGSTVIILTFTHEPSQPGAKAAKTGKSIPWKSPEGGLQGKVTVLPEESLEIRAYSNSLPEGQRIEILIKSRSGRIQKELVLRKLTASQRHGRVCLTAAEQKKLGPGIIEFNPV